MTGLIKILQIFIFNILFSNIHYMVNSKNSLHIDFLFIWILLSKFIKLIQILFNVCLAAYKNFEYRLCKKYLITEDIENTEELEKDLKLIKGNYGFIINYNFESNLY